MKYILFSFLSALLLTQLSFAQTRKDEITSPPFDKSSPDATKDMTLVSSLSKTLKGIRFEVAAHKTRVQNEFLGCTLFVSGWVPGIPHDQQTQAMQKRVYAQISDSNLAPTICKQDPQRFIMDGNSYMIYPGNFIYALSTIDPPLEYVTNGQLRCIQKQVTALDKALRSKSTLDFLKKIKVNQITVRFTDNLMQGKDEQDLVYGVSIYDDPVLELDIVRSFKMGCLWTDEEALKKLLASWDAAFEERRNNRRTPPQSELDKTIDSILNKLKM